MLLLHFRIEEIPAIMYARVEGVSIHSGLKPVLYMINMCLSTTAFEIGKELLPSIKREPIKISGAFSFIILSYICFIFT